MEESTITKYDRVYGGLYAVALFTKPSTIKNVQLITGKTETFVIQTARHHEFGDHIFIECMDDSGVVRLALPPKVANAIASQRDSLTSRRRSLASKASAKTRRERGELPGFIGKRSEPNRG
ncbi:MAG TPA: hypothetical protein VHQ22_12015 [Terriglobales bacterium]|jgi:hypothetical protein|nr:hypothetical protein [Terriglobales bacterium]